MTKEWSPDEPAALQFKYYALGIGNIRVGFSGAGQREDLVLRSIDHLAPGAVASVGARARAIDRRGYRISRYVYGRTPRRSIRSWHSAETLKPPREAG